MKGCEGWQRGRKYLPITLTAESSTAARQNVFVEGRQHSGTGHTRRARVSARSRDTRSAKSSGLARACRSRGDRTTRSVHNKVVDPMMSQDRDSLAGTAFCEGKTPVYKTVRVSSFACLVHEENTQYYQQRHCSGLSGVCTITRF
jgi:hypothetical protein